MTTFRKATEEKKQDAKLRFLTYNMPCFPSVCGHRFNGHTLPATGMERARALVEQLEKGNYDVIALQEIWDPAVADYLEIELYRLGFHHQQRGTLDNINYCAIITLHLLKIFQ